MVAPLGRLAFLSFCRPAAAAPVSQRISPSAAALPLAGLASITAAAWASPSSQTVCEANRKVKARPMRSSSAVVDMTDVTGYLNAEDSAALDAELMSTPGFSLEQLMELAGLSVAEAVYAVAPPLDSPLNATARKKILLVCGPGNNGGDGLVAARHLVMFGFDCTIVYPKRSKKEHFINLVKQCEDVGVEILDEMPADAQEGKYAAIVDAIFGFSFRGDSGIREPFGSALKDMVSAQGKGDGRQKTLIISVDVPSGWNVDGGDLTGTGFMPDVLVSLTAPKLSSKKFTGRHFVGGRFLPPAISKKYGVKMPQYPGISQVMEITPKTDDSDWEIEYARYLAEKEAKEVEMGANDEQSTAKSAKEEEEDWAVAYAQCCAEKERDLNQRETK